MGKAKVQELGEVEPIDRWGDSVEAAPAIKTVNDIIDGEDVTEVWEAEVIRFLAEAPLPVYAMCRGKLVERFGRRLSSTMLDKSVMAERAAIRRAEDAKRTLAKAGIAVEDVDGVGIREQRAEDAKRLAAEMGEQWERFLVELRSECKDAWFTVRWVVDYMRKATEPFPFTLPGSLSGVDINKPGSMESALGKAMRRHVGVRYGVQQWRLVEGVDTHTRVRQYRVLLDPDPTLTA